MNDTVLVNPKKLLEYLRVSTSIMKSPRNSFSRQELSSSLEMMDVLSDGELLYNLIQSKCNCVLWGKVREEMKNISLHIQQDL